MARVAVRLRPVAIASVVAGSITLFTAGLTAPANAAGQAGAHQTAGVHAAAGKPRPALVKSRAIAVPRLADPATVIPVASDPSHIVVDAAASKLYISYPKSSVVAVTDLNGGYLRTITNVPGADGLALNAAGTGLYVSEPAAGAYARIDTSTDTVAATITLTSGDCAGDPAYTGGQIWFAYKLCSTSASGIGAIASDDSVTYSPTLWSRLSETGMVALPDRPDRVVTFADGGNLTDTAVWDTTAQPGPVTIREVIGSAYGTNCRSIALIDDAAKMIVACGAPYEHQIFNTADLSFDQAMPSGTYPDQVAASSDGNFVAAGIAGYNGPDIFIKDISAGLPGRDVRNYNVVDNYSSGPVVWGAGYRLYAMSDQAPTLAVLHVYDDANLDDEQIAFTVPAVTKFHGTVQGSGTLTPATGAATTLTLTRKSRTGTVSGISVPVAADGTFSFTDAPGTSGPVTYTLAYAGDVGRAAASAEATTMVKTLPYDIKGTGYAALVVGSPGEDVGTVKDAGDFTVMYSGASGVTGTGSVSYTQDSSGVPGVVEAGDQFGYGQVSGDFNGDGYADLAVSSPGEAIGSVTGAGTVTVFYGSATGLKTTGIKLLQNPVPVKSGLFGTGMTVGDFNGDGVDDLAIGEPGTRTAYIAMGQLGGVLPSAMQQIWADTTALLFGFSLAAGDINGDGYSDLAVGAPYDYLDHQNSAGAVYVYYTDSEGYVGRTTQRFSEDTTGVPGSEQKFSTDQPDSFGWQVVLGDFNGDGKADLAIGAPGYPVTTSDAVKHEDAGAVTVLYSNGTVLGTTGAVQVTQATAGMPGNPGKADGMGATIAAGDLNNDGLADVAIFSPGDRYVTIVNGKAGGLDYSTATSFTQSTAGVYGTSTTGDYWGDSLRFENFKGAGAQGLAVGADGKHNGEGSVTVLYSTGTALTGTGSTYLDQDSTGVPGTGETGDGFGSFFSN